MVRRHTLEILDHCQIPMIKNKAWQTDNNSLKRRSGVLEVRNRILIVCEGEKSEPNYFDKFPIKRGKLDLQIKGTGYNCVSLVEETISLAEKAILDKYPYNQVWCVFDKDEFSDDQFNRACTLAENNKIRVAYSNQAFELWYLLHFSYCDTRLSRAQYVEKLNKLLKHRYQKNSNTMYEELKDLQKDARRNAQKLLSTYKIVNPAKNDPSTKVYKLVDALNVFL